MKRWVTGAILAMLLLMAANAAAMASEAVFTDIAGLAQENAVTVVCAQQLMNGVDAAHFLPAGQLNRDQLAVVLQRTFEFGGAEEALPAGMYKDVPADAWYASAARACAVNGVFAYAAAFNAGETITRIELATCLQRAFTAKQLHIPMTMQYPVFEDTEELTSEEMMAAIFVNNTGIMPGANGEFNPYDIVTRAELAEILLQIVELTAIDESYDNKTRELIPGQSLVVSLPANASTGYQWTMEEWDETILSLVSDNYLPQSSDPLLAGQGGTRLWKFKAERAGAVEVVFSYSRPWESIPPADTMNLNVVVDDPARTVALGSTRVVSKTAALECQLTIPVIRGMKNADAQEALNKAAQEEVVAFYETINGYALHDAADAAAMKEEFGISLFPYQAHVSYTPGTISNQLISYYQDFYQYTGGAHGNTRRSSRSIDAGSGQELRLGDLFVSGYNYVDPINQAIYEQIAQDTATSYFDTAPAAIAADADNFYLTAQGLVFYYQQYALAPYAAGILEYTIPFELLADGLKR